MSVLAIAAFIVWCIVFGVMCFIGLTAESHDPVAKSWTPPALNRQTHFTRPSSEQLKLLLINLAAEEALRSSVT